MGTAQSGGDRSPVLNGLEALLRETDFAWPLDLIGEDQAGKLATLTGDRIFQTVLMSLSLAWTRFAFA
jgi:hypothetical protein